MFGRKKKFLLRHAADEQLFRMLTDAKMRWHNLEHTQSLRVIDEDEIYGHLAMQVRAAKARYFFLFREAKRRKLSAEFVEKEMMKQP